MTLDEQTRDAALVVPSPLVKASSRVLLSEFAQFLSVEGANFNQQTTLIFDPPLLEEQGFCMQAFVVIDLDYYPQDPNSRRHVQPVEGRARTTQGCCDRYRHWRRCAAKPRRRGRDGCRGQARDRCVRKRQFADLPVHQGVAGRWQGLRRRHAGEQFNRGFAAAMPRDCCCCCCCDN
ncbi:unnamed protein product [Ectocarpus sp. 4 AP-2014]